MGQVQDSVSALESKSARLDSLEANLGELSLKIPNLDTLKLIPQLEQSLERLA